MNEDVKKIFVGGIPIKVTLAEFIEYFNKFGKIKKFILPKNQQNKAENCGYGFVEYRETGVVNCILKPNLKHYLRAKEVI